MPETRVRTLDDDERRRIGARRLAAALERNPGVRSQGRSLRGAVGRGADRGRPSDRRGSPGHRAPDLRQMLPLLAALPDKLGSNTALCTAVAGWSVGLVLSLMFLEVVRW